MSGTTRSPLRDDPLRLPGQSADEQIRDLIYTQITERIFFVGIVLLVTGMEWFRWAFQTPVSPHAYTAVLVLAMAVAVPQILAARRRLRNLRLGRDGERAVGQTLERLRRHGYHVFHDIIGTDWNVDHVVIGPGGVFTVETKTLSKPRRGRATITHDQAGLHQNGIDLGDCLIQARSQARFLGYLLGEETGKCYAIQPVVVFPGWFIEADGTASRDVWVLEPKAFLKWVRARHEILSPEQVRLARRAVASRSRQSYSAEVSSSGRG